MACKCIRRVQTGAENSVIFKRRKWITNTVSIPCRMYPKEKTVKSCASPRNGINSCSISRSSPILFPRPLPFHLPSFITYNWVSGYLVSNNIVSETACSFPLVFFSDSTLSNEVDSSFLFMFDTNGESSLVNILVGNEYELVWAKSEQQSPSTAKDFWKLFSRPPNSSLLPDLHNLMTPDIWQPLRNVMVKTTTLYKLLRSIWTYQPITKGR